MKDNNRPSLEDMLDEIPWYRKWFPHLPIWDYNETLRVFTFQICDCSVVHRPLTKSHAFDLLLKSHRKWWQPKYVGFSIWI